MTKIAMGNTCPTTGDFYSKLFGSSFQEVWGGSLGGGGSFSFSDAAFGRPQKGGPTLSWNQNWRPDVPSESFSLLQKPSPGRPVAEGYIHQGGKIYGNGKTWRGSTSTRSSSPRSRSRRSSRPSPISASSKGRRAAAARGR